MKKTAPNFSAKRNFAIVSLTPVEWLGILMGVIMPVVSAIVYPTYIHTMPTVALEWSRLLEAPFVLSEIAVIFWAMRAGMDSAKVWNRFPEDIKIAISVLAVGVFASSLLISAEPQRSITMSIITVIHGLFAVSVYHLLRSSRASNYRPFVHLLGAGLFLLAILTYWRFAFPPSASQVPGGQIEWGSALPGFISVRHFGSWTGAVTAGFLVSLIYMEDIKRISLVHILYLASAAMTVWSGTRAAVLAIFITGIILLLLNRKMPSFRNTAVIAMLTGTAMTIAWLLLPYNDSSFLLYTLEDTVGADQMTGGRLALWGATFEEWQKSPLFGWGTGSVFWEVYVGWTHTQPHNAILQFLISWGLAGAVPALWLLGRAIVRAYRITAQNCTLQPMLAILLTLLLMSLLEGMLHYPRFIMLIMVAFAAIFASDVNHCGRTASQNDET
jgi:exopolysaccharide production protein ExoQ